MLSQQEYQSIDATEVPSPTFSTEAAANFPAATYLSVNQLHQFYSQFASSMEMYAAPQQVSSYLSAHQEWFCRCAHPMKVEQISENGYALVIGRFGAFGYEVEPKIGLELLPVDQGIYRIRTIPVPNYVAPGYKVDFQAVMQLVEIPGAFASTELGQPLTQVEWRLDLTVELQFPKFIQRLPKALIQKTGDRLLHQIIKQVSRRLTYKVQEDFHKSLGLSKELGASCQG